MSSKRMKNINSQKNSNLSQTSISQQKTYLARNRPNKLTKPKMVLLIKIEASLWSQTLEKWLILSKFPAQPQISSLLANLCLIPLIWLNKMAMLILIMAGNPLKTGLIRLMVNQAIQMKVKTLMVMKKKRMRNLN